MWLQQLDLTNFRNYSQAKLCLSPQINIFVGDNAQGKTNLLESIYMLATAKSFRALREGEMVKHREIETLIRGIAVHEATRTLEIRLNHNTPKKIKVNKKATHPGDYMGNLNVVLFTPDDLSLIKGSPNDRRKFLDLEICQVNPIYRSLLGEYQKILYHRNALLKELMYHKGNRELLDVWNEQLVKCGVKIMEKRYEVIKRLGLLSRLMHRKLSNGLEELELQYVPFYTSQNNPLHDTFPIHYKKRFLDNLANTKELELKRGYTLNGPHRDDLHFLINTMDVKTYGSQGQQRTAILACRLAELEYMRSEIGTLPVILLDDVMSELDKHRKEFLLKLLHFKTQTIITTTTLDDFAPDILKNAAVFHVKAGHILTQHA